MALHNLPKAAKEIASLRGKMFTRDDIEETYQKYYSKAWSIPKWLEYVDKLNREGYIVYIYRPDTTITRYITGENPETRDKHRSRISNHLPNYRHEIEKNCDFFVGARHKGKYMTINDAYKDLISKIGKPNGKYRNK